MSAEKLSPGEAARRNRDARLAARGLAVVAPAAPAEAKPYAQQEASQRELRFLKNLHAAKADFDWIKANEAWRTLGHESFTAWWETRVAPIMVALGMRPTREVSSEVVDRLLADDADLPPEERHSKTEVAQLAGVSRKTVQRRAGGTLSHPDIDHKHCEKCGTALDVGTIKAAQYRCTTCDPDRIHAGRNHGEPCQACEADEAETQAALMERPETSAAVTAGNTDGIVGIPVGEPDVDELAASTSGTKDSGENSSDGEDAQPRVDPVAGSEPVRTGLGSGELTDEVAAHEQVSGWGGVVGECGVSCACGVTFDGFDTIAEAAELLERHIANPEERIERIGCPRCSYAIDVSDEDPDASLDEMRRHLRDPHNLTPDEALNELARVRTISPAAVSESDPTNQLASLQQSGPDSPTGREGDRSETDFPVESPDLSRLPVGELEDGGERALTPSSSDPREEPTATDRLLYAMSELAKYLRSVDVEALAPTLFPNELVALHAHADEVAAFAGRIERARMALTGGQA